MIVVLDNPNGIWLDDSNGMQPGDLVRLRVTVSGGNPDGLPAPIPPGFMWQDQTGRDWGTNGNLIMDDTVAGQDVTYDLFYGRVNVATDTVVAGRDVTRFEVMDQMGTLAILDKAAGAEVGAGELSGARIMRILANAGQGFEDVEVIGTTIVTMASTNLGKNALEESQLTAETEGGDFWFDTTGEAVFTSQDWLTTELRSTTVQAVFGGLGHGIIDAKPNRGLQIVINDATYSNAGGTAQNAQDAASIARYGHRTFRRLDLLGDSDPNALFLANRIVALLKDVRPRARRVEAAIIDTDVATSAGMLRFGDLIRVTVASMFGWGHTFETHLIGIEHSFVPGEWNTTFTMDDAFVEVGLGGAFDNQAFSTGFELGETP